MKKIVSAGVTALLAAATLFGGVACSKSAGNAANGKVLNIYALNT